MESKSKSISIKIFKEEEITLIDILYVQYKTDNNIKICDAVTFQKKRVFVDKICKRFSTPKQYRSNPIKNRMRELISKEPTISSHKIKQLTGYNWHLIFKYYIGLKKEIQLINNKGEIK